MFTAQWPVHGSTPCQEGVSTYKVRKITNRLSCAFDVARWIKVKFVRKNNVVTDPLSHKCEPTLDQIGLEQLALRFRMALPHTRKIEAARYVAAIIRGDA